MAISPIRTKPGVRPAWARTLTANLAAELILTGEDRDLAFEVRYISTGTGRRWLVRDPSVARFIGDLLEPEHDPDAVPFSWPRLIREMIRDGWLV